MAKPRFVSKLEDYRIAFDIAASLATVVALLAFYWSAQSAKFSRDAAIAQRRVLRRRNSRFSLSLLLQGIRMHPAIISRPAPSVFLALTWTFLSTRCPL